MEVDWAGKTASIIDNVTGEAILAYIFVATFSCSQYAYAEAFLAMNMESWINGHIKLSATSAGKPESWYRII